MSIANLSSIRRRVLRWYDRNKRDLPWRRTDDPYAIWIAETMLQQTQVKTVLPYYETFLRAFPTVDSLQRAPLERVLRVWSGLGYYRRAVNLQKAARQLVRDHAGKLPREHAKLRKLAGLGDYTAGAILSIAFGQRYAAVDGNVRRVLGRVFPPTNEKKLQAAASELVPFSRPGDFNQALMELGATVCTPREPRCEQCPLSSECVARSKNSRIHRSVHRSRVKFKRVIWPLAIVRQRGKILLRRRSGSGLLARLWELPGVEVERRARPTAKLRMELSGLVPLPNGQRPVAEIRHSITHRRIRAPIYLIDCPAFSTMPLPNRHWRWIDPSALKNHAVSSMTAKAVKALRNYEGVPE